MKRKYLTFTILLLFLSMQLFCFPSDKNRLTPFDKGEKLEFEIKYFFSNIWINVGSLILSADTINLNNKTYYNLKSESKTNDSWSWFYNVRSNYDVVSDYTTLKPKTYHQTSIYGRHQESYNYTFSNDSIELYMKNDKKFTNTILKNDSSVFDALSALYYTRTINFDDYKVGDSIVMDILHNDKFLTQKIIYEGIFDLETKEGTTVCYKFSSFIYNNRLISSENPSIVWVSTDSKRLPLKISIEIVVGKVDIYLKTSNAFN